MVALFQEFPFAFGLALVAPLIAARLGFGVLGMTLSFLVGLFVGAGIDYARSERSGAR